MTAQTRSAWIAGIAMLTLGVPLVQADHVHESGARFDHQGGNEWWVEVRFTPPDGMDSVHVLARSERSSDWHDLRLSEWGNWVGSFHVPPGERVQFQAARAGGMSWAFLEKSCYFTHPAGVEQCDAGATDPLRVTFRQPSGNDWWQQVYVDSNFPVRVGVDIITVEGIQGGALTKRSWGAHAASYNAPQGTMIQFRAYFGPEDAESACYRWTDAVVVECFPRAPVAIPSDTRFDHKGGNEWWVEAKVSTPYGPPTAVYARDEGGAWVPLTLRDWGHWAASFHIEPGHKVQLRAERPEQSPLESCWYTHPAGLDDRGLQVCGGRYPQ